MGGGKGMKHKHACKLHSPLERIRGDQTWIHLEFSRSVEYASVVCPSQKYPSLKEWKATRTQEPDLKAHVDYIY